MGDFWSAIIGAIVGALAAGGFTALLQQWQYTRDRRDKYRALGQSLFFKVHRIHRDLEGFRLYLLDCVAEAEKRDLRLGWQTVRPLANGPTEKLSFTPDELALLASFGDLDLLNMMMRLDLIHAGAIDIVALYGAKRSALTAEFEAAEMEGTIGTARFTGPMLSRFTPVMAELDDLLGQIRLRAEQDAKYALEALVRLNDALLPLLKRKWRFGKVGALEG